MMEKGTYLMKAQTKMDQKNCDLEKMLLDKCQPNLSDKCSRESPLMAEPAFIQRLSQEEEAALFPSFKNNSMDKMAYKREGFIGEKGPASMPEEEKAKVARTKATTGPNSNQEYSDLLLSGKIGKEQNERPLQSPMLIPNTFSPKNYLYKIGVQKKNRIWFHTLNCSTKDCLLCNRKYGFKQLIKTNLNRKYMTTKESYNVKVINDIIYNEEDHIVAVFKDFLIFDDISEFMKRLYISKESVQRLPKVLDYYSRYSQVFPNFILLEEKRFMFKNIERKQRVIDEHQRNIASAKKKRNPLTLTNSYIDDMLFTTLFLNELNKSDSLLGNTIRDNSFESREKETQMRAYVGQKMITKKSERKREDKKETRIEEWNLSRLVDNFVQKDSISVIQTQHEQKVKITKIAQPIRQMSRSPTVLALPKTEAQTKLLATGRVSAKAIIGVRSPIRGNVFIQQSTKNNVAKKAHCNFQSSNNTKKSSPRKLEISHKKMEKRLPNQRARSQEKITRPEGSPVVNTNRPSSKFSRKSICEIIELAEKTLKLAFVKKENVQLERNSLLKSPLLPQCSELVHSPTVYKRKQSADSVPITQTLKNIPERATSRQAQRSPLLRGSTVQKSKNKKIMNIDFEELNRNLKKQKLFIDVRVLRTAKANQDKNQHLISRTPNPLHYRTKTCCLNQESPFGEKSKPSNKRNYFFPSDIVASMTNLFPPTSCPKRGASKQKNLNKKSPLQNPNFVNKQLSSPIEFRLNNIHSPIPKPIILQKKI